VTILSYNQTYQELKVMAEGGQVYVYEGVSGYTKERVERLLRNGRVGEAWGSLKMYHEVLKLEKRGDGV